MNAYADKQKVRDGEYARHYKAWVESLPPEERARLAASDLLEPELARVVSRSGPDISERNLASDEPPPNQAGDDEPAPGSSSQDEEAMWAAMRRMLGELLGLDNIRLTLECFALVTGITYLGDSMTTIAQRNGVTRSAVSKRCVDLSNKLNLNPSRAMRRLTARQRYEQRQKRILHRHERFPASDR